MTLVSGLPRPGLVAELDLAGQPYMRQALRCDSAVVYLVGVQMPLFVGPDSLDGWVAEELNRPTLHPFAVWRCPHRCFGKRESSRVVDCHRHSWAA